MRKRYGALSAWLLVVAVILSMSITTMAFAGEKPGSLAVGVDQVGALEERAPTSISAATMMLPKAVFDYTGKAVKPIPTIKVGAATLTYGSDFMVAYKGSKNASA